MLRRGLLGALLLAFVVTLGVFAVTATACEGGGGGGKELTSLATSLSGGGKEGETITAAEGTKVKDKATLSGKNASSATGKVTYKVYSEKECKTLVKEAGEVTVSSGSVPASSEEELEAGKTYYWQAYYSGDSKNDESTSPCTETLNVQAKTSISTTLSDENKEGSELTAPESLKVKDKATLTGINSSTATGKVVYKIYSDSKCEHLVQEAGEVTVSAGSVPASNEEELEGGATYYWLAIYKGDGLHQESNSTCGGEILPVKRSPTAPTTDCPITSEGVKLHASVKASNEAALREEFIKATWLPVGEAENGGCKKVGEYDTAVGDGEIAIAQTEEYEKYVDELVVPGTYIYAFKWHESGGTTFETLGVTNAAVTIEFEPIGTWYIQPLGEQKERESNEEEKGVKRRKKIWTETAKNGFGATVMEWTTELTFTTPDNEKVENQETLLKAENKWLLFSAASEVVKEKVATEPGGLQCYESKVRFKGASGLTIDYVVNINIGFTKVWEVLHTLCADGS